VSDVVDAPAQETPPVAPTSPPQEAPVSWHAKLAPELQKEKTLLDFKDENALAKSYLEMKKWQSGAIKKPGPDAKPEEIARYREALGVPKTAKDYDLSPLQGLNVDQARVADFLEFAHASGQTQEQVQATIKRAYEWEKKARDKANEDNLQKLDGLAKEWGKPVFDQKAQYVKRLFQEMPNGEALEARLEALNVHNDPELFQAIAWIGEQFAEQTPEWGGDVGVDTEDEIKNRIAAIRAEIAKEQGDTPRHRELVAQMEGEYKKLTRGK